MGLYRVAWVSRALAPRLALLEQTQTEHRSRVERYSSQSKTPSHRGAHPVEAWDCPSRAPTPLPRAGHHIRSTFVKVIGTQEAATAELGPDSNVVSESDATFPGSVASRQGSPSSFLDVQFSLWGN